MRGHIANKHGEGGLTGWDNTRMLGAFDMLNSGYASPAFGDSHSSQLSAHLLSAVCRFAMQDCCSNGLPFN
jgi:hypothetical protein